MEEFQICRWNHKRFICYVILFLEGIKKAHTCHIFSECLQKWKIDSSLPFSLALNSATNFLWCFSGRVIIPATRITVLNTGPRKNLKNPYLVHHKYHSAGMVSQSANDSAAEKTFFISTFIINNLCFHYFLLYNYFSVNIVCIG